MSAGLILITLFSWICAGCTVNFFWQCFHSPHQVAWSRRHGFLGFAYYLCVWIGVGYCIFRGAEVTVQWMPRSWVSYSEDGDSSWVGDILAGLAAFIGSILLLEEMGKVTQKLAEVEKGRNR
jgi:hypothetical protein